MQNQERPTARIISVETERLVATGETYKVVVFELAGQTFRHAFPAGTTVEEMEEAVRRFADTQAEEKRVREDTATQEVEEDAKALVNKQL